MIIPISLYVTIEVIKLMQIYHIHQDDDFKDKKSGKTIGMKQSMGISLYFLYNVYIILFFQIKGNYLCCDSKCLICLLTE